MFHPGVGCGLVGLLLTMVTTALVLRFSYSHHRRHHRHHHTYNRHHIQHLDHHIWHSGSITNTRLRWLGYLCSEWQNITIVISLPYMTIFSPKLSNIMDRIDPAEMAQLKEGLQQKVAGIVEAVLSLMSRCSDARASCEIDPSESLSQIFRSRVKSILQLWTRFSSLSWPFSGPGGRRGEERVPPETGGEEDEDGLHGRLFDSDRLGLTLGIHWIRH